MPGGSKTNPTHALSTGVPHPSVSRDGSQSNQRVHRITPVLDSSGSQIYNKLGRLDSQSEDYTDHLKVMMQTRVAVRDKTPHRFQIVPLREVSNLGLNQTEVSTRPNFPTTPLNILHHSASGKLEPYSQTRSLQSTSTIRSLNQSEDGEDNLLDSPQESLATNPHTTPRSADHPHSRNVLAELDLNRDTRVSMATTNFRSKPVASKSVTMRSVHSRDPLTSLSHTETSIAQTNAYTGFYPRQDVKHHTITTLGTHISEISQLFSSENVAASLPSMRRNRSMTVSSIRSDTSVGMSDTSQETEAKLKRRHAIYRESSYMPYLGKSQGKNLVALGVNFSIPILGTHRNLAKDTVSGPASRANDFDQDACSAETPGLALLRPPFKLKPKYLTPSTTPHIPNSGAGGSKSVRALELSKNKHVSRQTSTKRGETAYPRIVLDLLREIDEAIAQWDQR